MHKNQIKSQKRRDQSMTVVMAILSWRNMLPVYHISLISL